MTLQRKRQIANQPRGIDETRKRRAEDGLLDDKQLGDYITLDRRGRLTVDVEAIKTEILAALPEADPVVFPEFPSRLEELDDCRELSEATDGQTPAWDAAADRWEPVTPSGGGGGATDHGALTGLADDDHAQYLLADGSRALTGNLNVGSNNITSVGTVDGRDVSADGSALDALDAATSGTNTGDETAASVRGLGFFDTTNDGAASGLDSDLLDGQHGAYYLGRANHTGTQAISSISDAGALASLDTVSSTEIDALAVTLGKIQNISTASFLGRSTAGLGSPEVVSASAARTILNVADGATANDTDANLLARGNHTGTQTLSTISDSGGLAALDTVSGTEIDAAAVTLSKIQNISTASFLARSTAGLGSPEVVSASSARTILNVADGATANDTDANLLSRANHTGTQTLSTISDSGALAALDTVDTAEIDDEAVTLAKMAHVTGPGFLGRALGTGDPSMVSGDTALAVVLANRGAHEVMVMSATPGLLSPVALLPDGFLARNGSSPAASAAVGTDQVIGNTGSGLAPVDLDAAVRSAETGRTFVVAMAESATMNTGTASGYQFSVGNGETGTRVGFVAPFDARCIQKSVSTHASNTSTINVRINAPSGSPSTLTTVTASGSGNVTSSTGDFGTVSAGDLINFQTASTSGTLSGPHVMQATFVEI